jgi:SAM-dependent methyltransferase
MDERLKRARSLFSSTATEGKSAPERVGRPKSAERAEELMWRDIQAKLIVADGNSIVDIGVGNGLIARKWLEFARSNIADVVLADFPEVIDALASDAAEAFVSAPRVSVARGEFPQFFEPNILARRFDRVVAYGVIQYSDDPASFIETAVGLLQPGGRLLIGDLPNISKKGRFLASPSGRLFDAQYKGVAPDTLPVFSTHHEFVASFDRSGAAVEITDRFLLDVVERYRDRGCDVYILEQPSGLPFCQTREDLLICAPRP